MLLFFAEFLDRNDFLCYSIRDDGTRPFPLSEGPLFIKNEGIRIAFSGIRKENGLNPYRFCRLQTVQSVVLEVLSMKRKVLALFLALQRAFS